MHTKNPSLSHLMRLPPEKAAKEFATLRCEEVLLTTALKRPAAADDWLSQFTAHLETLLAEPSLQRTLRAWGLSQSAAARQFGVSRQALHKWLENGPPIEKADDIASLAAATDLLLRHLKRERIPAVVRRPIAALGGVSLLDLLGRGETQAVYAACRRMFDFQETQG